MVLGAAFQILIFSTSPGGAPLDDAGYRGGPTLGRLLEGVSHERARCLRRHSDLTDIPDS